MRGFAHALIVAIPVFVGGASAVHAANTSCTGTLSGSVTGNIVVPVGASCTLSDATVTGDLQVLQNASLTVDATQQPTTINGNVLANQCASALLEGGRSTILGYLSVGLVYSTVLTLLRVFVLSPKGAAIAKRVGVKLGVQTSIG